MKNLNLFSCDADVISALEADRAKIYNHLATIGYCRTNDDFCIKKSRADGTPLAVAYPNGLVERQLVKVYIGESHDYSAKVIKAAKAAGADASGFVAGAMSGRTWLDGWVGIIEKTTKDGSLNLRAYPAKQCKTEVAYYHGDVEITDPAEIEYIKKNFCKTVSKPAKVFAAKDGSGDVEVEIPKTRTYKLSRITYLTFNKCEFFQV